MKLILERFHSGKDSTLGTLHVRPEGADEFKFQCFTLEDQYQKIKVPKETRIPAGTYQVKLRKEGGMHLKYEKLYPFHSGMLHVQDVPGFEWVYIHVGNTDDNTEGCLLVGTGASSIGRCTLFDSVAAYTDLYKEIVKALSASQEVWISIVDYA